MQSRFRVLLVLTVATAPTFTSSESPQISWTVQDAVDFYNNRSNTDYVVKLVERGPEYGLTMKVCSTILLMEPERNAIMINCDCAIPEHARVWRSSLWPNLWPKKKQPRPGSYCSV